MRQAAALGLACALACGSAHAKPFTVEDLLSLQDLGRTSFSPDGRWLVVDVQAPWRSAARFDLDAMTYLALGRPMVADVEARGPARPLLPFEPGAGYTTGAYSPDGSRIIVYRQIGETLELGVVALSSGETWWSGVNVEAEVFGTTARWSGPHRLVILSRSPDESRVLPRGWLHQSRSTQAWAQAAAGRNSGVAIGSGRYRSINPPPPSARLILADLTTGKIESRAEGAFVDMTLSPNGERVALVEDAEPLPSGLEAPSAFKSSQRRRLVLVDLSSGRRQTPCPTCDLARIPIAWSPDSRVVLAAARLDSGSATFSYWILSVDGSARNAAVNLATGESTGRDPAPIGGAAWLSDRPAVLARPTSGGRLDWWRLTARGVIKLTASASGPAAPALAQGADGLLINAASGPVLISSTGRLTSLASATARLSFAATLPGEQPRSVVATDRETSRAIWPRPGRPWPSPLVNGERVLDTFAERGLTAVLVRDGHGVKTVAIRTRTGAAWPVLTLNTQLGDFTPSTPTPVSYHDAGSSRTSWLYLPQGQAADTPLIVIPYPGASYPKPPSDGDPGALALTSNIQVLASRGYAVLVPSLPMAANADPGKDLANVILTAVDAARDQHRQLSVNRLAIWGQSFGGWGALMAATQTDRFKAVIATSPITDLFTYYGHLAPQSIAAPDRYLALPSLFGWSETGQGRMLGPPWQDTDRNFRNSPGLLTHKITTPVMLVTSDSDFTSGQSTPVFTALYREDKDAQLLTYRGEGHVLLAPGNVRDFYARALAFLDDAMGAPSRSTVDEPAIRPSQ
jgi:dipeptidyl aminopeptidase/acylaminoacyl peptidase